MKPISTYTHGAVDYGLGILFVVLPFIIGWTGGAEIVMLIAGVAMLGMALLTRYELGLIKTIPMRVHLNIDFAMGVLLVLTPLFFIGDDTALKTVLFVLFGLGEIAMAGLTQPVSVGNDVPVGGVA